MKKTKRTRVTKDEIAKAREELIAQASQAPMEKTDPVYRQPVGKWVGLVYCDPYGWAWVADTKLQNVCLGETDEILKELKRRKVDTDNVLLVLQAVQEFRTEKKTQSYHLRSENGGSGITTGPQKSHRITFKKAPHFLGLLDGLIEKGYGVPTIQRELRAKGYDVPYATLGRWIRKRITVVIQVSQTEREHI